MAFTSIWLGPGSVLQKGQYNVKAQCLKSMGESNTVVNAYTMYRHLQQYCSHTSKFEWKMETPRCVSYYAD